MYITVGIRAEVLLVILIDFILQRLYRKPNKIPGTLHYRFTETKKKEN